MLLNIGVSVNLSNGVEIFLLVVCKGGYVNVVEKLIKVNVDVNLSSGNFKLLKFISVFVCKDDDGMSNFMRYLKIEVFLSGIYIILLIVVCVGGYICIVEILIEVGVDVNIRDGYIIFFEIVNVRRYLDVVKIMMKYRED